MSTAPRSSNWCICWGAGLHDRTTGRPAARRNQRERQPDGVKRSSKLQAITPKNGDKNDRSKIAVYSRKSPPDPARRGLPAAGPPPPRPTFPPRPNKVCPTTTSRQNACGLSQAHPGRRGRNLFIARCEGRHEQAGQHHQPDQPRRGRLVPSHRNREIRPSGEKSGCEPAVIFCTAAERELVYRLAISPSVDLSCATTALPTMGRKLKVLLNR